MPGQDPPFAILINQMRASLAALEFLRKHSDLSGEYLGDLGERLYHYYNQIETEIRTSVPKVRTCKPKCPSRPKYL